MRHLLRPRTRHRIHPNHRAPMTYLVRDDFNDTLSAGSVNGTGPTPGPGGPRLIIADTGNKISIGTGKITLAANTGTGDPQIVWAPVTRGFGRTFLAEITPGTSAYIMLGFRLNTSVNNTFENAIYIQNGVNLTVRESATAISVGQALGAAGTTAKVAVVVRATAGAFYFVKGNGFTNWTLFWISTTMSGATLYPALSHVSGANAHTSDYVRVPFVVITITPLISDGFASVFGTSDGLGHQETSGPGSGGSGVTWTHNTYSVSGGKAINTPSKGTELLTNTTFDSNTTSWAANNATLASVAGGQSNNALQVTSTNATATTAYAVQGVTTVAGDWVLAVVYHKNGTQSGALALGSTSGGTNIKSLTVQSDGSWTQKLLSGRAQGTTTYLRLAVGAGTTNDTTLYDEASIKKLTLADLFSSVSVSAADVIADVALTVPVALDAGLVLNLDSTSSPANLVIVHLDRQAGTVTCVKYVAGTPTQMFSTAITYSSGAVLRVAKIGSSYKVYYNGAFVNSATIADAGIVSNTKHGLFSVDPSCTMDNFVVYASGSSNNEYSVLDNY